jgi:hypothetical protein
MMMIDERPNHQSSNSFLVNQADIQYVIFAYETNGNLEHKTQCANRLTSTSEYITILYLRTLPLFYLCWVVAQSRVTITSKENVGHEWIGGHPISANAWFHWLESQHKLQAGQECS